MMEANLANIRIELDRLRTLQWPQPQSLINARNQLLCGINLLERGLHELEVFIYTDTFPEGFVGVNVREVTP